MKIGIIGTGAIGSNLGKLWAAKGHTIMYGSRDPQSAKVKQLVNVTGPEARAGSEQEAAAFGEVVMFAVPWSGAKDAVKAAGDLSGKIVIDCSVPVTFAHGYPELSVGGSSSGAEELAALMPNAKFVRSFTGSAAERLPRPLFGSAQLPAAQFMAGDNKEAKAVVAGLIEELGFAPVDVGGLVAARGLEALVLVWANLAFVQGWGREVAFAVLKD